MRGPNVNDGKRAGLALRVRLAFAVLALVVSQGCTRTATVAGPGGRDAQVVECHDTSPERCYAAAARVCPQGYVLPNADKTASVEPAGRDVELVRALVAGIGPSRLYPWDAGGR